MDDQSAREPSGHDQPEAAPPEETSSTGSMLDKLGPAEKMVVIGAAIVMVDFVLFELVIGEYFFFWVTWLVAGWALAAAWIRHNRDETAWPVPYGTLLRVLGLTMGAVGLATLVSDLRFETLEEGAEIIGAIALYVGAGMMWWGARSLRSA